VVVEREEQGKQGRDVDVVVIGRGLTSLGLMFCGTPMAIVVGMTAGLLSIIPFVGPALGFVIALALTLAEEMSLGAMVWLAVVFAVVEAIENFVLTPKVMQGGADLHPLTIIFCVVFWGAALGGFGALVAIPLTLVVKVLARAYLLPAVDELAEREPEPTTEPGSAPS
jgi:predicted PurR-regulated permease PerM